MPIEFACQHCGKSYTVADEMAGQAAQCQACNKVMAVPGGAAAALPTETKRGGAGKVVAICVAIAAPLIVAGVAFFIISNRQKPQPEPAPVEPVVENPVVEIDPTKPLEMPADANVNGLMLAQFDQQNDLLKQWVYLVAYEVDQQRVVRVTETGQTDRYQRVWLPLYEPVKSKPGSPPAQPTIRAVVRTNLLKNSADISAFLLREGFAGLVVGKAKDVELPDKLTNAGLNTEEVWVIELARSDPAWLPPVVDRGDSVVTNSNKQVGVPDPPDRSTTIDPSRPKVGVDVPLPSDDKPKSGEPQHPSLAELKQQNNWTAAPNHPGLADPIRLQNIEVSPPADLKSTIAADGSSLSITGPIGEKGLVQAVVTVRLRPLEEYERRWPRYNAESGLFERAKVELGAVGRLGFVRLIARQRNDLGQRWNFRYVGYAGDKIIDVTGFVDNDASGLTMVQVVTGTIRVVPMVE